MTGVHRPTGALIVLLCALATFAALELLRSERSDGASAPRVVVPAAPRAPTNSDPTVAEIEKEQSREDRAANRRIRALKARRRREERRLRREARARREEAAALRERRKAQGPPPASAQPPAPAPVAPAAPAETPKTGASPQKGEKQKDTGGQEAPAPGPQKVFEKAKGQG